ncbi:MAG: hypothetical protein Q9206_004766 [Seirophora lacunosa]
MSPELFSIYSQSLPSQNLGFVDPKCSMLDIEVAGRNLSIVQSPALLSSDRAGGTTGAVVWKITPLFADWIASPQSFFLRTAVIDTESTVLELGCGVSGIVGFALAPRIGSYLATDQDYVSKILRLNLENNMIEIKGPKEHRPNKKKTSSSPASRKAPNPKFLALDWETDAVGSLPALLASEKDSKEPKIDVVLACDCIYNESLIDPFVRTCEDLCRLAGASPTNKPTICVIAQQLRSPGVFEAWLTAFMRSFRVWRVPDTLLSDGLKENSGFVIHIGVLRSHFEK